ncbi:MAG: AMP-binding protein [Actinobacteria bacterium]|nr:AMP-binding protein [Actinomycetota bacterium]
MTENRGIVMAISYEWTPDEQRQYSLAKLYRYIKDYIYPYHPYYRKLFKENKIDPSRLQTYDDLRRIPITTKEDTIADQKAFILQPKVGESDYDVAELSTSKKLEYMWKTLTTRYIRDLYGKPRSFHDRVAQTALGEWNPIHYHMSGGTTGLPSMATYTNHDIKNVIPYIAGMLYLFGWEPNMRGLNMFPGLPHLDFFQVVFAELTVDNGAGIFHTCGGKAIPTESQVLIAGLLPFDMYIAIPSYMTYWLKTAAEMIEGGMAMKPDPVKYAVLAAEPLSEEYRAKLKDQFEKIGSPDIKIIEGYGSTELRAAFFECDEQTKLHLNPEFYYWEVLDPETKEPVPWGEPGVLAFSHIDWRGTVLLRYWMGDLIEGGVVWEKCSKCGLTMPILRPPIGRAARDFTKIKGARVPLMNFQNAIRRVDGVESFQVIVTKEDEQDITSRDRVIVYACLKPGADEEVVKTNITKQVKVDTEISPDEVVIEQPEKIEQRLFERTGLQADWVVDKRELHV